MRVVSKIHWYESFPAIVLDDSCLLKRDFSCSLMGKIKDINALSNLYFILANEGFGNVKLSYLGGLWVLIDMDSIASKEKIGNHVGVGSWFNELKQACNSFVSDDRIVWISIEGLPIKAFTHNTFDKIVSPWGELNDLEDYESMSLSYKRLCVKTKPNVIINDKIKVIVKGQVRWIHVKELEAWSPKFIAEKKDDSSSDDESEGDHKENKSENNGNDFELDKENEYDHVSGSSCMHVNDLVYGKDSNFSEHPNKSEDPFEIYKILKRNKETVEVEGKDP
ncbi:hypothetical protein Tco_0032099 [Tanacetum coccineum]